MEENHTIQSNKRLVDVVNANKVLLMESAQTGSSFNTSYACEPELEISGFLMPSPGLKLGRGHIRYPRSSQ